MLIIYGNGTSGMDAEKHYRSQFKTIVHRDAAFFEKPEKCEAFALECFHTSHIFHIRAGYEPTGIPEAYRADASNKPEPSPPPPVIDAVDHAEKKATESAPAQGDSEQSAPASSQAKKPEVLPPYPTDNEPGTVSQKRKRGRPTKAEKAAEAAKLNEQLEQSLSNESEAEKAIKEFGNADTDHDAG